MLSNFKNISVSIIGLGYVGLPLLIEFSKKRKIIGYDKDHDRIKELKKGFDRTKEIDNTKLLTSTNIKYTNTKKDLHNANCFIICVPTPISKNKKPDLKNLISASKLVAQQLKKKSIVIYESTVYPGLTEEICIPLLEKFSKLKYGKDFYCGYSPERVNPGDKTKKINKVKKLVSGTNKKITDIIAKLYEEINPKNIIKVESIKIAEAAKLIENCQRDLNIAFMNELSIIFSKMQIDTNKVLKAAETKWNFARYYPGLVGGHCIGVDPYYLSYKSQKLGLTPKILLSGRKINNDMPKYVVKNLKKGMSQKKINITRSTILIMGLTFKENCPDIRNSKVFEIISLLNKYNSNIHVFDPWVKLNDNKYKNFKMINRLVNKKYDAVIVAVGHKIFKNISISKIKKVCKKEFFLYDLKNFYKSKLSDLTL